MPNVATRKFDHEFIDFTHLRSLVTKWWTLCVALFALAFVFYSAAMADGAGEQVSAAATVGILLVTGPAGFVAWANLYRQRGEPRRSKWDR
jgi:hypothetical protein